MQPIKNSKGIGLIIAIVGVVGLTAYTLWPRSDEAPADTGPKLLEFRVIKTDLEQWEIDQYTQEFENLKAILEANPELLDGLLKLGQLKKYVGDYAGAEAAWIRAGEIRPYNSTSFGNLADLYVNFIKDYTKAEQAYRVAIKNSANEEKNAYFYRNYYSLYKDYLRDDQRAEQVLLEGIAANPKSGDLELLLGIFYKDAGKIDQAIEHYERGIALYPEPNPAAEQELAELKRRRQSN